MRAGLLRNRIEIQRADVRRDANGQPSRLWTTIANVWAAVEPLRGAERFEAHAQHAQISHKVRLRFDPDVAVTTQHRLLFGTRIFHVESVANLFERDRTLELMCREEV